MINFTEHPSPDYRERTISCIQNSDITLAFAIDFSTHGERLTRKESVNRDKIYIPIDFNNLNVSEKIVHAIKIGVTKQLFFDKLVINIAGNGIYTLKIPQGEIDAIVFRLLQEVCYLLSHIGITKIEIITGGQTGVDEAGAKAGDKLGFPTTVVAPKGWKFRDVNGKDISNEGLFKGRFL